MYTFNTLCLKVGPAVGPVIGGALSQHLGWRYEVSRDVTVSAYFLAHHIPGQSSGSFVSVLRFVW